MVERSISSDEDVPVRYFFVLLFVLVSACGSSSGGDSGSDSGPAPTNAGGIWTGSTFDDQSGLTFRADGVITENGGSGRFFNENGVQFIFSGISGTDGKLNATITAVAPFGSTFVDGSVITQGTLTGTVSERQSLEGDWSLNTSETGTFTMSYDDNYEAGSSLSRTQGLWLDPFGVTWDISADGTMFSQDSFGCTANGQVSIINENFNVYEITVTLSGNCEGMEGDYDGLGVTDTDGAASHNMLVLQINNNEFMFTESWQKR